MAVSKFVKSKIYSMLSQNTKKICHVEKYILLFVCFSVVIYRFLKLLFKASLDLVNNFFLNVENIDFLKIIYVVILIGHRHWNKVSISICNHRHITENVLDVQIPDVNVSQASDNGRIPFFKSISQYLFICLIKQGQPAIWPNII